MRRCFAFLALTVSLIISSCSSGDSKDKPKENSLHKVLNAPKKFSKGVHKFDSAVKKVGVGINKLHEGIQKYQPDSTKNDSTSNR
jgi:hypothetical protein